MIIFLIIISLSVLILIHELGHFSAAKMFKVPVSEFGIGFPPRLFSKKLGETVYSINALPFGGFVKIEGEDGENSGEEKSFLNIAAWKKAVILSAGVVMNIILGWIVLSSIFFIGTPQYLAIDKISPGSPAEVAGLFEGDVIMGARFGQEKLEEAITADGFVEFVSSAGEEPITLSLKRGGKDLEIVLSGRESPPPGEGSLGVAIASIGFGKMSFFEAVKEGLLFTIFTLKMVVVALFQLVTGLFVDPKIIEDVAGPIGIFAIASQAGELGLVFLFQLMAFISINLAVINLIPFPALDGGRLLFLAIEKVKGSAISFKTQSIFNIIGFAILIMLMIAVTIKDVLVFL